MCVVPIISQFPFRKPWWMRQRCLLLLFVQNKLPPQRDSYFSPKKAGGGGREDYWENNWEKNVFCGKENYLRWFPLGISVSGIRWVISQNSCSFEFTLSLQLVRNSKGWQSSVPIRCACTSRIFLTLYAQVCGKELSNLTRLLLFGF